MAWGSSQTKHTSTLGAILPLLITLVIIAGAAWVGYQIWLSINKVRGQVTEQMGKGNVVFTKDGVKVGVKHVDTEHYVDQTQNYMVKAWNLSSKQQDKDLVAQEKARARKKA